MSYTSKYTGKEIDNGINPVGTIISLMRKTAPEGYLICDGRELNIADYPALSTMFEEEFGSKNVYGGDGTTTFAVPDLRNEFLRGYHNGGDKQLSAEVGKHQDATEHQYVRNWSNTTIALDLPTNYSTVDDNNKNKDTVIKDTKRNWIQASGSGKSEVNATYEYGHAFTSRPTNVAVLYCIKY